MNGTGAAEHKGLSAHGRFIVRNDFRTESFPALAPRSRCCSWVDDWRRRRRRHLCGGWWYYYG
jgi:hypothetical protein